MKKLFILFVIFWAQLIFAQIVPEIEWLRIYDGVGHGNDFVNDMKMDNDFNSYLAGRSEGINGTPDFSILKYSNNGDSLLNIRLSSAPTAWDEVNSIAVDAGGNIYAIGSGTFGQSTFYSVFIKYSPNGNIVWNKSYFYDPDSVSEGLKVVLTPEEDPVIAYSKYNPYLSTNFTKYSANGDSIWTTQIKDDTSGYQLDYILADPFGNIYAALTQTYYPNGGEVGMQIVILKLDQNGHIIWTRILKTESVRKMIIDSGSDLIVETNADGILVKYTSDGDSLWSYQAIGLLTDITLDNDENILVCGYAIGINNWDYLAAKVSPGGTEIWHKTINSYENLGDYALSVITDEDGNAYVTGSSHDMISIGSAYTLKFSSSGEMKWQHRFDAPHGIFENPQYIFLDDSNDVMIGGDYSDSTNGSNFFLMKIKQKSGSGVRLSDNTIPSDYYLSQNYPNPFNPGTKIDFSIPRNGFVKVEVYDALGRKVKELINSELSAGNYSIDFNASDLSSGIYYYRLTSKDFAQMKKAVLLK